MPGVTIEISSSMARPSDFPSLINRLRSSGLVCISPGMRARNILFSSLRYSTYFANSRSLAEEIKATLLTGRLDTQANIWRRLPLEWLLLALGRTHEAFVLPEEEKEADALLLPDAARTRQEEDR